MGLWHASLKAARSIPTIKSDGHLNKTGGEHVTESPIEGNMMGETKKLDKTEQK